MNKLDYIPTKKEIPPENIDIFLFVDVSGYTENESGLDLWYGFYRDGNYIAVVPDNEGLIVLSGEVIGWLPVDVFNGVKPSDCSHLNAIYQ